MINKTISDDGTSKMLEALNEWVKYSKSNYSGDGMNALDLTLAAIRLVRGK